MAVVLARKGAYRVELGGVSQHYRHVSRHVEIPSDESDRVLKGGQPTQRPLIR